MDFNILHRDPNCHARTGLLHTDHGEVLTPVFMPVGTHGAVKAMHVKDLKEELKAEIMLGNTYHLFLRPGNEIIEQAGGLHRFNGWDRPILTDSGGYQVFSLSENRKINEEGIIFSSHIDGSKHRFTPENNIDTQRILGADIIMALDECTPYPCDHSYAKKSMELTHRWLARGLSNFMETQPLYGHSQAFFPIVQGSTFTDLRADSAKFIAACEAEGNAIGGLSVGEPVDLMYEMTSLVCSILPDDKPRYLMGVGTPANLLECIALGVDMFDCVLPTRNGRNGMIFTAQGVMNMKNEKWKNDFSPLSDPPCSFVDLQYSRAFIRHLFVAGEMLGPMIASVHNLGFYFWLMKEARKQIRDGHYLSWKNQMVNQVKHRL